MKQAKRLLALLLALTLCAALFPAALAEDAGTIAPAEEPAEEPEEGVIAPAADPDALTAPEDEIQVVTSGECGDNLTWSYTGGTLTISGTGPMWDYTADSYTNGAWTAPLWQLSEVANNIKKLIIGNGVTSIGNYTFDGLHKLDSVSIPSTVVSIGDGAFSYCDQLPYIAIPASVQFIGQEAFMGCIELTRITLSNGITEIKPGTFSGCGFSSFTIPDSVRIIGEGAFEWCEQLKTLTIPAGVEYIFERAFECCTSMEEFRVEAGNQNYVSVDGVLYSKDMRTLLQYPVKKSSASYAIPSGVKRIGEYAFARCRALESITIPGSVTSIGEAAFSNCIKLASITIPGSVTSIGDWMFSNCRAMKTIRFSGSAPTFDGYCCFYSVTAIAYYPADDPTWTEEVRQDYEGDLTWIPCRNGKPVNSFTDVTEGKYYYEPVLWAYYHDPQITGGTSETTFSPNKTCTREQIVTFLWKACGAPEPFAASTYFTDVKESKYYYKAVLWAVEKGVTGGVSDTLFGVGRPCTREQAMTFLWKACGSPPPENSSNPFSDVLETKYYYNAVLWAVEKGITGGMGNGLFGVGVTCTRGQIVTFLYAARGFLKT